MDEKEMLVFPSTSLEPDDVYKWTHQNTLILIDLYKTYKKELGTLKIKNLKKMFLAISNEMQNITNTKVSAANCENRWKVLERNYKKYVVNAKQTGRRRQVFEYAEEMNAILGDKKNIHPTKVRSSENIDNPTTGLLTNVVNTKAEGNAAPAAVHEQGEAPTEVTETVPRVQKKKPCENKRLKFKILKEIRNDRKKYYEKRLRLEEQKLQEQIRKNDLQERRNELLEKAIDKICPWSAQTNSTDSAKI